MMHHIHYLDKNAVACLSDALMKHYLKTPHDNEIVVICIGTNRYPGDALGPAVGSLLHKRNAGNRRIRLFGTLDRPVHALNLQKTLTYIAKKHSEAYIIAVDACIGQFYKIGTIQLVEGPLEPGAGLGKNLPSVGHIHFKGIINNHKPLNYKVLEHTSLTFVHDMAEIISRILEHSLTGILPALHSEALTDDDSQTNKTS